MNHVEELRFDAEVVPLTGASARLILPVNPVEFWGLRSRYHITGTVSGYDIRGPLAELEDGIFALNLGEAWCRDHPVSGVVAVCLRPEGPQLESLDPDLAEALAASPAAQAFFESLATFYRKGYLKWLAGSSRRPEVRRERIQEWIRLLEAGKKQRE